MNKSKTHRPSRFSIFFKISALLSLVALTSPKTLHADTTSPNVHKVVFELTSKDPKVWDSVANNIENTAKAFGKDNTQLELIAHGEGIESLLKNSEAVERFQKLLKAKVIIAACENTMAKKNLKKTDLMTGIITVDSGVAELVRKQEAKWAYIKSGG